MRKGLVFFAAAGLVFLLSGGVSAQSGGLDSTLLSGGVPPQPTGVFDSLKFYGWGAVTFGEISHGFYNGMELNHKWQEGLWAQLGVTDKVNQRLNLHLAGEWNYQYSTLETEDNSATLQPAELFYLHRADIVYSLLQGSCPITVQGGYFPFKYNAEARNLGEYLFRSGCYPNYVTNSFDFPLARVLGVNVENTLFNCIHQNLLLTSETQMYPYKDFSLSYLLSGTALNKAIEIGGGIQGYRLISVDNSRTTPHTNLTVSYITNARPSHDANGIPDSTGDTTFYSFAGTKVMAHATLDLKPLLNVIFNMNEMDIFGKEDCKLYGEIAILGLRNYPVYHDSTYRYDIRSQRMPILAGFNVPTFKLLDVLAAELEYYPNPYDNNDYNETFYPLSPLPYVPSHGFDTLAVEHWKWSFYAKKSLGKNMEAILQVARDHRQAPINTSDLRLVDCGDNMFTAQDWYFMVKVVYGF